MTSPRNQKEDAIAAQQQLTEKMTAIFRMAREKNFDTPLHLRVTNANGIILIEMTAYDKGLSGFHLVEKRPPRSSLLKLPITILLSDIARTRVIKLKITRDEGWLQ